MQNLSRARISYMCPKPNFLPEKTIMSKESETNHAGEYIVFQSLRSLGYTVDKWETHSPGSQAVEAHDEDVRLLLQVRSAVYPNDPPALTSSEERVIELRAVRIGAEAGEARVRLNESLDLKGEIMSLFDYA